MPSKKSSPKKNAPPNSDATSNTREPQLWLVCFDGDRQGERPSRMSFEMVLQAPDVEAALSRCETRLEELRDSTTLFQDPCRIYLRSAITLPATLENTALLNWAETFKGDFGGTIDCAIPEQEHVDIQAYGLTDPEGPGGECSVFAEFGDFRDGDAAEETQPKPVEAMGEAERKAEDSAARFERLLMRLQNICETLEGNLAQGNDTPIRPARAGGRGHRKGRNSGSAPKSR